MAIEYLDEEEMEAVCHRLAVKHLDQHDDPIPPFSEHDPQLLESALNLPRATFGGQELYPTLEKKAAALYYSLVKNHAFPNGNKRLATTALLVFLYVNNGQWLDVSPDELAEKTIEVATSDAADHEKVLNELQRWISEHLKTSD